MMVFTTPVSKNAALEALTRFLIGCILSLLLAGASAATEVSQLHTERADDGIFLSADIYRDRWYWSNPRVTSAARTLRLSYQPLTRRWRVNIVPGLISGSTGLRATLSQHYDTLPEALSAVQQVARWRIAEASELDSDAPYLLSLNFRLDLSQLPRPFQIGVAGHKDWTIAARLKEPLRLVPAAPAMPAAMPPAPAAPALSAAPAVPAASAVVPSIPAAPAATEARK